PLVAARGDAHACRLRRRGSRRRALALCRRAGVGARQRRAAPALRARPAHPRRSPFRSVRSPGGVAAAPAHERCANVAASTFGFPTFTAYTPSALTPLPPPSSLP